MKITKRQATISVLGIQFTAILILGIFQFLQKGGADALTAGAALAAFVYGGVLFAYLRGWEYARHVSVVLITLIVGLFLPEPFVTTYAPFLILLGPVLALVIINPIWVIGSAVATIGILLFRAGGIGVYASLTTLVLFAMLIAGLIVSRFITETAYTQLNLTQEALKDSQVRMAGIINSAMDAIISIDKSQRIVVFNPAAETMFGCDRSTAIGQTVERFLPERFRAGHPQHINNFSESGLGSIALGKLRTIYGLRSNGDEFPIEASISQIRVENKELFTVILRDISERKQIENALLESEERFRKTFRSIPVGLAITNASDGTYIDANPAFSDITGFSLEELIGQTSLKLNITSLEQRQDYTHQIHEHGFIHNQEMVLKNKSGESRVVLGSMERIELNNEACVLSTAIDVSGLKHAEAAFLQSQERFTKAFHANPAAMIITRKSDGHVIDINESFEIIQGYSREELLGNTGLKLDFFDQLVERQKIFERLYKYGSIRFQETQLITKSGELRKVIYSLEIMEIGGEDCVLAIFLDITDRKQAEETLQKMHDELELQFQQRTTALSQATALLETMLDYVPDQIYFKDVESRFIKNSRSQARALGVNDPVEVVGKTDFDFFPHAQRSFDEEQEIIRSGNPLVDFEERVVWPDGKESWLSTTKVPLRDQEGKIIGTFGISRDITDRKRVEESLRKAKNVLEINVAERTAELSEANKQLQLELSERKRIEEAVRQLNENLEGRITERTTQLESANKELEAFSYSVSHDLRSPLRGIDGWSLALLEDYGSRLDEKGRSHLQRVRTETQRMGTLIDDILQLSRITRSEMNKEKVDLSAIAEAVAARLQETMPAGRQVIFNIQKGLTTNGDPKLLDVVFTNLLDNAFKFTGKKQIADIGFGQTLIEDAPVFFVRDNGAGFDMASANKLFGAFQRMHRASEFPGTGVGLATAQRVIHRHGGKIWVESEVGQGTTFYFTLEDNQ